MFRDGQNLGRLNLGTRRAPDQLCVELRDGLSHRAHRALMSVAAIRIRDIVSNDVYLRAMLCTLIIELKETVLCALGGFRGLVRAYTIRS